MGTHDASSGARASVRQTRAVDAPGGSGRAAGWGAARPGSDAEAALAFQLRAVNIPFEEQVQFAPPRKWRADFRIGTTYREHAIDDLLVEVDGGAWIGGRHTSGAGFTDDCEKQSAAAIAGFRVIRCTPKQVESGECLRWIEAAR